MEKDSTLKKYELTVIADECGDSMLDTILEQSIKTCNVEILSENTTSLLPDIDAVQVSNTLKN